MDSGHLRKAACIRFTLYKETSLTVYVVVVVVPVQRRQHLVLQLDGQDLLLVAHLEGNGAVKHPAPLGTRLRRPRAVVSAAHQRSFLRSLLLNYHCRVLRRCWEGDAQRPDPAAPAHNKTDAVDGDLPSRDVPTRMGDTEMSLTPKHESCQVAAPRGKGTLPGATQVRRAPLCPLSHPSPARGDLPPG